MFTPTCTMSHSCVVLFKHVWYVHARVGVLFKYKCAPLIWYACVWWQSACKLSIPSWFHFCVHVAVLLAVFSHWFCVLVCKLCGDNIQLPVYGMLELCWTVSLREQLELNLAKPLGLHIILLGYNVDDNTRAEISRQKTCSYTVIRVDVKKLKV